MNHKYEKIDVFKELCRERGLRLTHQRLEIFSVLAEDGSHPSIEDIYNQVVPRLPMISLDTVYRTIATFEEYGLVRRVNFDGSKARFDTNLSDHHHLVCLDCQRVVDFYWPSFDRLKMPRDVAGWDGIDTRQAEIRGICPACQAARKGKKRARTVA
jgi:Fur family peroxide stress response transcriptional regulator